VSARFLPASVKQDLNSQREPKLIARYATAARLFTPQNRNPKPKFEWSEPGLLRISGNEASGILPTTQKVPMTFPSDLGLLGLFDFACVETNRSFTALK
jgi:hypothetical protein